MKRVAVLGRGVLGRGAAGKSLLAARLGRITGLPVIDSTSTSGNPAGTRRLWLLVVAIGLGIKAGLSRWRAARQRRPA